MNHRLPIVGGNWKMNTDLARAVELADDVLAGCAALTDRCEVAIFPPFPYLQAVGHTLGHYDLQLGAQDVFYERGGAFTGEVSPEMLLDLNVEIVLIGHSERRHVIGEDDELINRKARAALEAGLKIILCIGETIEQREADLTESVTVGQLISGLEGVSAAQLRQVTIAYEPVWAIGTGRTASPDDAQEVHGLIRRTLVDLYDAGLANSIRIQYGGSVNARNARDLFAQPDIDGGLIGGASLQSDSFVAIVQAAVECAVGTAAAEGTEQ